MYFDRNNATLLASPDELATLARCSAEQSLPSGDERRDWESANIVDDGRLDPTVVGIVAIMNRPLRSVVLERFDGQLVDLMFIAWDRSGRATMANGIGDDALSITATQLDLLPPLLTQAVRLHPRAPSPHRGPIITTAAVVEQALAGSAAPGPDVDPDLQAVLGAMRHAWRATGGWYGKQTDTSLTVLSAGDEGLWAVRHDASTPGGRPNSGTVVQMSPCSPAEISRLLGDVVTGRAATPAAATAAVQ